MPDQLSARTEALAIEVAGLNQAVNRLSERISGLREDLGNLADRQSRSERRGGWTVIAVLVALSLVAGVAYVTIDTRKNADDQTELRNDVLCPLYGIFLGSYDPKTRDRNPDPQARQKYEDAFTQIRHGWVVMGCTGPIVPPRSN